MTLRRDQFDYLVALADMTGNHDGRKWINELVITKFGRCEDELGGFQCQRPVGHDKTHFHQTMIPARYLSWEAKP